MKETFYKSSGDLEHNGLQKEWSIIRKFDQQIADSISKEGRRAIRHLMASDVARVIESNKERSNISSFNIIFDYPSLIEIKKQFFMSLKKVYYKGKEIPMSDIKVDWTDCFGDLHNGSIEDYANDYAQEEVAIAEAGEGWQIKYMSLHGAIYYTFDVKV